MMGLFFLFLIIVLVYYVNNKPEIGCLGDCHQGRKECNCKGGKK